MGTREISEKYHRNKLPQAINAAIRAEVPAGHIVLDLLYRLHSARSKATGSRRAELDQIFAELQSARKEMVKMIADRYELTNIKWSDGDERE